MKIRTITICLLTLLKPQANHAFTTTRIPSSSHQSKIVPKHLNSDASATTHLNYRKPEHQDESQGRSINMESSPKRKSKKRVYKHLFRHYGDISFDSWLRCEEPESFLQSIGYTREEL